MKFWDFHGFYFLSRLTTREATLIYHVWDLLTHLNSLVVKVLKGLKILWPWLGNQMPVS